MEIASDPEIYALSIRFLQYEQGLKSLDSLAKTNPRASTNTPLGFVDSRPCDNLGES